LGDLVTAEAAELRKTEDDLVKTGKVQKKQLAVI